jgi:aminopeptidase N
MRNYSYRNYGQNYSKVAVMMRYLQHYLGESKIDIILKDYFESWKFKHPKSNDLITSFNKHLDDDVSWFFENLIDSTTYIDYMAHKKNGKIHYKK